MVMPVAKPLMVLRTGSSKQVGPTVESLAFWTLKVLITSKPNTAWRLANKCPWHGQIVQFQDALFMNQCIQRAKQQVVLQILNGIFCAKSHLELMRTTP